MNSIIYLTDNSLDEHIAETCRRILALEAGDLPIIAVSQNPIDFGINICLGEIGRSWTSLYKQLLAGVEAAPTDWVVICEHDCLYTKEHLNYRPADPGIFWYNLNCWLVNWGGNHPELDGMYSRWVNKDHSPRLALSQLICDKDLLKKSITERLDILATGGKMDREFLGCGEPGVVSARAIERAKMWADSGQPVQLQRYLKDYLQAYESATFETELPNLDIRHGSNFTGPKRGKNRTYELPHWGRFAEVMV